MWDQQKEVNTKQKNKMTKNERTMTIEKTDKKIIKEKNKSPVNKDGTYQEIAKNNKEIREETKNLSSQKDSEAKEQKADPKKKKTKSNKTEAIVRGYNLPISTKDSAAICKFIRNKKIEKAIADLENVALHKKAIPMKGEIPHRKGKGISSGRYLNKSVEYFIKLLKSLNANSNANELEGPIITQAIANIGKRPYGRFGRTRKKRTHVLIKAEKKTKWKRKK